MGNKISNPKTTLDIIQKYEFTLKKNYGQNFLIDNNVLVGIADSANITKDDYVLEIGPGIGSLTQELCERAKKVVAVEIDTRLIPILEETLKDYKNLSIINKDILKLDINKLIKEEFLDRPIKVVANLPYYITTPIIMELLEGHYKIESITLMIQKEVAERISATPNNKSYGALSVAVQYYCDISYNFTVSNNCFVPKPKVDSGVITLNVNKEPKFKALDEKLFFKLVKCAFGQRRKTLLNSIINQSGLGLKREELLPILEKLGYSPTIRGEALSVEEFSRLSYEIGGLIKEKESR